MKEFELTRIRGTEKLDALARRVGIKKGTLSKIERGAWPGIDVAIRVAKVYGLNVPDVVRQWLLRRATSPETLDILKQALVEQKPARQRQSGGAKTATIKRIDRLAMHRSGKLATDKIVEALYDLLMNLGSTSREPIALRFADPNLRWKRLAPDAAIESCIVFYAPQPIQCLFALHRFPPTCVGYHRQGQVEGFEPGFELWSVSHGEGRLVLIDEEGELLQNYDLCAGCCGYYWGGHGHAWVNASADQPLVVLQGFYPYRRLDSGPGALGEACEFYLPEIPADVPEVLRRESAREVKKVRGRTRRR